MDTVEKRLREELCSIARRMYHAGFSPANGGNISVRLEEGLYLITPSGVCKADLTPEQIVKMDDERRSVDGKGRASSEARVHLICYHNRPDVQAVCHTHSPYGVAFSAIDFPIGGAFLPEQIYYLGDVPRCRYARNGTQDVADSMLPYIRNYNVMLLGHHGPVTMGSSLDEAYARAEELEHYLKVLCIARPFGGLSPLTDQEAAELYDEIREEGFVHPCVRRA